jgi:hypothetical protein
MALGHPISIDRLHGPCSQRGHAEPGPPRALFFFLFLFLLSFPQPAWTLPWAGPFSSQRGPASSRPIPCLKTVLTFLFLNLKPVHQSVNNLRSTIRNQMKPSALEPDFQYLSHATDHIFLGFLYKF